MLSKKEIRDAQKWRKGIGRKGLSLSNVTDSPKLGKKTKGMSQDALYDYIVNNGTYRGKTITFKGK